jgi:glucokinase
MENKLSSPYVLTADVGGSHITTAICNIESNTIVEPSIARVDVSSKDTAENILNAWQNSFHQSLNSVDLDVSGLGIAMPGPFDYENGISYITGLDKFDSIYGLDIKHSLAKSLQLDPVVIKFRNDAEASIAGEVWANFGKNHQNVIGVTLGTGFGSAHYLDGVTKDTNWGSEAFKNSIADDYLSTRWFLKRYYELTGLVVSEVKELVLMTSESPVVADIFKEFADNLGNFLEEKIAELKPEMLVICGNIAKASELFLPNLKTQLSPLTIELARLGENAALFGVASLFENIGSPLKAIH